MSTITITLLKSSLESCDGIGLPKTVYLDTDIPASVFYTLDGSIPTSSSDIYVDGIPIPEGSVNFRIRSYATNGHDASLITEFLLSSTAPMDFFGEGGTNQPAHISQLDQFPFGPANPVPNVQYFNESKQPVYDQTNLNAYPNGFDADGNPNCFTNLSFTEDNYQIQYNLHDSTQSLNEQDYGNRPDLYDFSNQNIDFQIVPSTPGIPKNKHPDFIKDFVVNYDKNGNAVRFDPNAHVIYQDCSNMNELSAISYNSQNFTYVNVFEARYASKVYGVGGWESPLPTMTFLNWHYNPTTNMLNFYYVDSINQKYIISSVPVTDKIATPDELYNLGPTPPGRGESIRIHRGYSKGTTGLYTHRKIG